MTRPSAAISDLLSDNVSSLPRRWLDRSDRPFPIARKEVFWACMSHLVACGLLESRLPHRITIGRDRTHIELTQASWKAVQREIGWDRPNVRKLFLETLSGHFVIPHQRSLIQEGRDRQLAEHLPPRLLGLLLLTVLLEVLGRHGPPQSFKYELHDLTKVATKHLQWAAVGRFEETEVVRQLFHHAGEKLAKTDVLLKVPYHAYWRSLLRRIPNLSSTALDDPPAATFAVDLPSDFLLRGLRESQQEQSANSSASSSYGVRHSVNGAAADEDRSLNGLSVDPSLTDEVNRLREENEHLQAVGDLLLAILQPLLWVPGDPIEALEAAAEGTAELTRDLALAVRTLLASDDIELLGVPGEVERLVLPRFGYEVEGVGKLPKFASNAPYRVGRRGLAVKGHLLAPILVTPLAGS